MLEMYQRGRHRIVKGSSSKNAKLTEELVTEIKALYKTGRYSHESLAHLFGVSEATVQRAIVGTTWAHV